jgi:5'-3' exonuclease
MGEPFFKMVYDDNLFIEGGAQTILKHPKLEADDCIAISVKYLLNTYSTSNIYIITSDKDYLQLAQERVQIYDLAFKKLTEQKSSTGDPKCDLFCKILTGDPSDNISSVFPRCGPKTAMKYYQNQELFKQKLQESTTYQTSYELNSKIIDFNNIPEELAQEFLQELVQEF